MDGSDRSGANLPYATRYLKDNQTFCTHCMRTPAVEEVILGHRECVNGHHTDRWYHSACFFVAMKAKGLGVTEAAIRGMSWLKWDDQELIREQIDTFTNGPRKPEALGPPEQRLGGCRVEHAKTAKGKCGTCKEFVNKDEAKYFCKGAFHHLKCLMELDIVYTGKPEDMGGYAALKQEEKDAFAKALKEKQTGKKKVKTESGVKEEGASTSDEPMMVDGGEEGDAADEPASSSNPLLAAARRMARKKMNTEITLTNDSQPADSPPDAAAAAPTGGDAGEDVAARAAEAAGAAPAAPKPEAEDDDEEIQLLDVVKSDKPPVVVLGGESGEEKEKKEEAKMVEKVEKVEEKVPDVPPAAPAKPSSSLNDLFARFQQEKKRESLSTVLDQAAKKPRMDEQLGKERLQEQLKKQADALWKLREVVERLRESDLRELMKANDMYVPEDYEKIIMSVCDAALFGAPGQCPKCPDGRMIFNMDLNTYECMGNVTEWTKCTYTNKNPTRSPLGFPRSVAGRLSKIEDTGVVNLMSRRYYPVASGGTMATSMPSLATVSAELSEGVTSKNGILLRPYVPSVTAAPVVGSSGMVGATQIIKKGTVVDGECEYASVAHVFRDEEGTLFSCSLTLSDMATNRNSYFKMQLLQHDASKDTFYVFKSGGRVGTELGWNDTRPYGSLASAMDDFLETFADKTGNAWEDRKYFRKRPGKMAMVDMDYSEIEEAEKTGKEVAPGSLTKLDKQIQSLILRIFDENMFKSALKSFDLDMEQMPLGKLSKRQLTLAYGVLNELQQMVQGEPERALVIDATNRFYSLIPHNFGHRAPELLDTKEIIEKRAKLIENLMDIAIAVDLMKDGDRVEVKMGVMAQDPIDIHYLKLKSEITVLPKSHADYKMIETYAKNSHGSTHASKIKITDIFCVSREGEEARFNAALGNRMLLWHGSRLSNFVGIISQGLRIAPPEAPATGYMFGKGIYFADMVSKSANYCHPDISGKDAFLLLCDVALGQVQEEYNATNVTKPLKNGANSIKGMGCQFPDPANLLQHKDGFVVPFGKATFGQQIYLQYNEFIVYDVSQVRIRYLVRTKMNYR